MNKLEHTMVCGAEEANEVASAALAVSKSLHKMLRFGKDNIVPRKDILITEHLVNELNDLEACIELLIESGVELTGLHDRTAIQAKKDKIKFFMEHSRRQGVLQD